MIQVEEHPLKGHKKKYNLTFWQKLSLPFIWVTWYNTPAKNRKSWHEVKKGMEHHKCNYTIPGGTYYKGRYFKHMQCDHEGCNMVEPC